MFDGSFVLHDQPSIIEEVPPPSLTHTHSPYENTLAVGRNTAGNVDWNLLKLLCLQSPH